MENGFLLPSVSLCPVCGLPGRAHKIFPRAFQSQRREWDEGFTPTGKNRLNWRTTSPACSPASTSHSWDAWDFLGPSHLIRIWKEHICLICIETQDHSRFIWFPFLIIPSDLPYQLLSPSTYTFMYIHTHICTHMCTHMHIYIHVHAHTHI